MTVHSNSHKRVAVALSGGVDSATSALLLRDRGYEVITVFLDCQQKEPGCSPDQDRRQALQVANTLNLPFHVFDLRREYRKKVLDYFFTEYQQGNTPNPDIVCNRDIKFGLFLKKAFQELKVGLIATGHYARNQYQNNSYHLLQGRDKNKDQSYFLYSLNQEQLRRTLFPVGGMKKEETRQTAKEAGLPNWDRPDSQGICFVGKVDLIDFLKQKLPEKKGPVVDTRGKEIGYHRGSWFYTIGQRHGFTVTKYQGIPLYVLEKKDNTLVVGPREDCFRQKFEVKNLSWVSGRPYRGRCGVRIRHLGKIVPGEISPLGKKESDYAIKLSQPLFAVASGQSAVFYLGEEVLGGGVIA